MFFLSVKATLSTEVGAELQLELECDIHFSLGDYINKSGIKDSNFILDCEIEIVTGII